MTINPEGVPPGPDTGAPKPRKIKSTRVGFAWVWLVASALIGILLLIFILQNLERVEVDFLFWSFRLPLGVGTLLATIGGALIAAVVGGWRIVQLRREARNI